MVQGVVSPAQHLLEHQRRCICMDYLRRLFNHHAAVRHQHVSDKERVEQVAKTIPLKVETLPSEKPKHFITLMIFRYDHKLSYNAMALSSFVALEQKFVGIARSFIIYEI